MEQISIRLKDLRKKAGLTQQALGNKVGVQKAAVQKWESGRVVNLKRSTIKQLAEIFHVTPMYLVGLEEGELPPATMDDVPDAEPVDLSDMVKVPIIGSVKAGPNGLAYQDQTGYVAVDSRDVNGGRYFILQIYGDSMIGEGIMPGDLALVREQSEIDSGDLAVVLVEEDEMEGRIKRVYFNKNSITLQSSNPAYPPEVFTGRDRAKVHIVGKVKRTFREY